MSLQYYVLNNAPIGVRDPQLLLEQGADCSPGSSAGMRLLLVSSSTVDLELSPVAIHRTQPKLHTEIAKDSSAAAPTRRQIAVDESSAKISRRFIDNIRRRFVADESSATICWTDI